MGDEKVMKEMIKKSKLTPEELKAFREKTKDRDPKQSHYHAYRTMMNETRRELLKYIGLDIKSFNDLKNQFSLEDDEILYHLSMLEQCCFIINSESGWKTSPVGLGLLLNTQMGDI